MAREAGANMSEYDSRDDCVKSYYAAIEAKRLRGDADADALARTLFHKADATGIWCALDHPTQLYWRKEAARKVQQERYKEPAKNA